MAQKLTTLLSIAGSDPMGGAGIQSDIRVGQLLGLHVLTAITSVTSQNSKGVKDLGVLKSDILHSQLESISEEVCPDAIKIGMIGSKENLFVIKEYIERLPQKIPVVIDPILAATSDNSSMLQKEDRDNFAKLYTKYLFPVSTIITPNLEELMAIINLPQTIQPPIAELKEKFPFENMVVTGWRINESKISDLIILGNTSFIYDHNYIDCNNLHGTGCCFSSLLAGHLAFGYSVLDSIKLTHRYMDDIIRRSCDYFLGKSDYGPLNIVNYKL